MNKQVIFGTTEYHEIMRQIVTHSLQRKAGYIALKMAESGIQRTPVHENYLERVDPMMQALANNESLVNCNPRAPYLLLAWLLVGSDNPYRSCQYIADTRFHKQAAIIHIRIALGDIPLEREINVIADGAGSAVKSATSAVTKGAAGYVAGYAVESAVKSAATDAAKAMKMGVVWVMTRETIRNQTLLMAKIDDSQALSIARQLTIDILALKDCNDVE